MYGPREYQSREYMECLDEFIGLLKSCSSVMGIVADHGMEFKNIQINPVLALREVNIKAIGVPLIKDRYIKHHRNLGGVMYLYLKERRKLRKALCVLKEMEGIEHVFTREEAAIRFHLPPGRIGDIILLGAKNVVFDVLDNRGIYKDVSLRSHGSLHEQNVPLIVDRPLPSIAENKLYNKDALITLIKTLLYN